MSNNMLSSSRSLLLISRNASRFHSSIVRCCFKRSKGIRSASINLLTLAAMSMPETLPPTPITIYFPPRYRCLNFLVNQYPHIFCHSDIHVEQLFRRNFFDDFVRLWVDDRYIIFFQLFMKDEL